MKLYIIDLSPAEREELTALVEKGTVAAYRRRHAQILLLANQGTAGSGWSDSKIASHVGVTVQNVERIRKRCVLEGLEAALGRRKRSRGASYGAGWRGRGPVDRHRLQRAAERAGAVDSADAVR